jgi:DnaJ-domain-containing protein 1
MSKVPDWIKFIILVGGTIATMAISWGNMEADLRVETTERKMETQELRDADVRYQKDIDDIKQMLQEEMDRHHPRN